MPKLEILNQMGSTDLLLREIFTAKQVNKDLHPNLSEEDADRQNRLFEIRERFEKRIQSRLNEHCEFTLKNHHIYSAVDVAWDSPPISKQNLPLLLYAQGMLDHKKCVESLRRCTGNSQKCNDFLVKDDDGNDVVDIPKFVQANMNMVRSFVTRRLAAQSAKYSNLYPYYKFEPRGNRPVDKLKADVLSQRVDIMTDDYGYRNHDIQVLRNALLYAQSIDFIAAKWDIQHSVDGASYDEATGKWVNIKTSIDKEGLQWVTPHPLRTFYDMSSPVSGINTGDVDYVGYWDIIPYRDIAGNRAFYNQEDVTYGEAWVDWLSSYAEYFNLYYNTTISSAQFTQDADSIRGQSGENDRANNVGRYAGQIEDAGCRIAQYFERINPAAEGIGDYPEPVWVRFVVAGDKTVIFAEFLPSRPASYCGYNVKDDRRVNISFAHEVMPFQDQMSNLVTQMLDLAKRSQFSIYEIDEDYFDEDEIKKIKSKINSSNWDMRPMTIQVSRSRMESLNLPSSKDSKPISIIQPQMDPQAVQIVFNSMVRMIELAERVTAMSANETGQPISKSNGGVTATEADQIGQTTNNVHAFVSESFDEFRASKKQIICESIIECHQGPIIAPVVSRYPQSVVERAGFQVAEDSVISPDGVVDGATIIGTPTNLRHNYIFTSRDGSERSNNINAANTLVQLMGVIKDPAILQSIGKAKFFEMLNSIYRMMDAGIDLNLEVKEGEEDFVNQSDEIIASLEKLAQVVQANSQQIEAIKQQFSGGEQPATQ